MTNRYSSIEVLRVLSMLFVVLSHTVNWGMNYSGAAAAGISFISGGINSYATLALTSFASLGVICFVMISSYFICQSNVLRLDRIFKIWCVTAFYSVLITTVLSFFSNISVKDIILSIVPVATDKYWFVTKYLALMILAPFLSFIVNTLSRKGFIVLLVAFAIISTTITCGIPYGNVVFGGALSEGTFIFIFFIAAYLRKFGAPLWLKNYCGRIFWASIALQVIGGIALNVIHDSSACVYGGFSVGYNAFSLVPATALFVWFCNHEFKDNCICRSLVKLAPYTFAVYLIHDNPVIRRLLWGEWIDMASLWNSPIWTLYAILIPVGILIICSAIDWLRAGLFKLIRFDKLVEKVRGYIITIS
ncbi:MAG: acyltransferase [Bacteroidales bacterium]|nr:acyltransferase [Bacteroidales bacterium]